MKTKKPFFTLLLLVTSTMIAKGQVYGVPTEVEYYLDPNFAVAILAGVIIAVGVQIFLTALSIASGITAIGDLKETYVQSRVRNSSDETYMDIDDKDESDSSNNAGTKVAGGVGVWSIITLGISAFVGSLLAMNLVVIESIEVAITVALVIWALFCIMVVYFEGKLLGVIVGGLTQVATSGFKMSSDLISGAFSTSKEKSTKKMIDHTVEKVRDELKTEVNLDDLKSAVDRFVNEVDNKVPDYGTLKEDLQEIIKESRKDAKANAKTSGGGSPMKWVTIQKAIDKASDTISSSDANGEKREKLKSFGKELKAAFDEGETQKESIKNVAKKLSPQDEQTTDRLVEKVMDFISTDSSGGMNFEGLKKTFDDVKSNPSEIVQNYADKIGDLDREKVKSLLANNTNYSKEEVDKGAEEVEKYVRWVKQQAFAAGDQTEKILDRMDKAIASFFNETGRPELQYHSLKHDLDKIFDDPKSTPQVVRERTEQFSSDTLIALITAHTSLSEEDIENLKKEVEDSKQTVIDRMTRVESEARGRIEMIKKKAVIQAEHTRATAAAAAWWLVLTGLISAGAAVGGAVLSI
ncbi:MAG TPA: hypothetical protein VJ949_00805 [Cryomorphaceae bacterium]|nr:hypothetical protein [Cryomorphaceae bacterium]